MHRRYIFCNKISRLQGGITATIAVATMCAVRPVSDIGLVLGCSNIDFLFLLSYSRQMQRQFLHYATNISFVILSNASFISHQSFDAVFYNSLPIRSSVKPRKRAGSDIRIGLGVTQATAKYKYCKYLPIHLAVGIQKVKSSNRN